MSRSAQQPWPAGLPGEEHASGTPRQAARARRARESSTEVAAEEAAASSAHRRWHTRGTP